MKLYLCLLIIVSSLSFINCSSFGKTIQPDKSNSDKIYSTSELEEDLNFLLQSMMNVHPSLYSVVDSVYFYSEVRKVREAIKKPMTRLEFYKMTAPIIASLKCGHADIYFPLREWNSFREAGGRYFPYSIIYDNGVRVRLNSDSSQSLPPGTRILEINGLSADSLFISFKKNRGGELAAWQNMAVSYRFRQFLWLYGIKAPFEIKYLDEKTEKTGSLISPGALHDTSKLQSASATILLSYSYKMFSDSIAYINYISMGNDRSEDFQDFLQRVFTDIKTRDCKGLIIDLRQNGGGNSFYGSLLLSYITNKAFRMINEKHWKASAEYKSYMRKSIPWWISWVSYRPAIWIARLFREEAKMFTASDTEVVIIHFSEEKPGENPLLFKGPVCFLAGTNTFSSAMMVVNAVKNYKLGTIIGSETGGAVDAYGEIYEFNLPNTSLRICLPSAYFVRSNDNNKTVSGVIPDILVNESPEDMAQGKDKVLERAKTWILEEKRVFQKNTM